METTSPRPLPRQALYLATAALATLIGVHMLPGSGGVDPVRDLMSEYPVRTAEPGVAYTLALLGANLAVVLLGAHWVRDGLLRSRPVATTLLGLWCLSLLGLTVVLKDPVGGPGTWYGTVHMVCTVVNFVSLPALCGLLWWRHRGDPRWRSHARAVGVVAGLTMACVVPFALVLLADSGPGALSDSALGLVERCVVVLDVVAIAALARWSRASGTVVVGR
ncbi:DUF998 domain-containing protein [Promicromonospora sp. NPDC052451]|uniref:DUF998 domain-containing protein n=1 Tax=Promicromonospora sp. NPDC052451 TaxID=3364407 RepID=UPI0037C808B5